jgi:hypothetical protein
MARRAWSRISTRLTLVAVVPLMALLAAACGGTGNASTGASTGASAAEREAALLNFSKCMRQHGVNIPDPTVDANGNVQLRPPQGSSAGATNGSTQSASQRQKFQTAQNACRKYLQGVFQGFSQADRTKLQDAAVKYAQCMRAHGYNLPDPNFNSQPSPGSGGAVRGGPFSNVNRNDPAFKKANQACQSIFTNAGLPAGGAGFGGGNPGGSAP